MIDIQNLIEVIDYTLDSSRKRHIAGGILLSLSLFFGGLAITTITMKKEEEETDEQ